MAFPYRLLTCVNCRRSDNTIVPPSQLKIFDHLFKLHCLSCNETWLACPEHNLRWGRRRFYKAFIHLEEENHVKSHFNLPTNISNTIVYSNTDNINNHNSNAPFIFHANNIARNENGHDFSISNDLDADPIAAFLSCEKELCFTDYNEKFRRFLEHEVLHKGDGMRSIVSCAFTMDLHSDKSNISYEEAKYHLLSAKFCCSLSSSQQDDYSNLCFIMSNMLNTTHNPNTSTFKFHPPTSAIDIDRYYLKNSTSIYSNIPIPIITEFHDHACVSIKSVIQHFLYFETEIDGMLIDSPSNNYKSIITPSSPVLSSIASHKIRAKVSTSLKNSTISPLILYVILWSDDFEPNNVKQNKKSTWIKTITIAPPTGFQTSSKHTYVISLGSKEHNHEEVNKHFCNELASLENPTYMYCSATESNIPVVVQILAISADRPERSALNFMLGHNGTTSKRWRYAAYINSKTTRSCKQCILKRANNLFHSSSNTNNNCMRCCDWNYSHPLMGIYKPDDYPTIQHPDSPTPPPGREILNVQHLYPIELTYSTMIQGVKFCFFNCFHGSWKKVNVMSYMKSMGINDKYSTEKIYSVATSLRRSKVPLSSSTIDNYISFPIHWTCGIELDQCIDTPMHHLFQGIVKSVMELTIDWLSRKDGPQYKEFGDYVDKTMSDFHQLSLDWCKLETFSGGRNYTLGGWQAEQYVAFSRCILILYSAVRDIVGASELGINAYECLIQSLHCLLSRLMSDDESESMLILDYVKCFLSCCDTFERTIYNFEGSSSEPIWATKGNFLSLLNLHSQVEKFGSIRCYWEGSRERSIQLIKPYLINMRSTTSYYRTKLNHMYVSQTLKNMTMEDDRRMVKTKYSSFKVYSVHDVLSQMITFQQVLSAVLMPYEALEGKLYICQRNNPRTCLLYLVTFNDDNGFNKCGVWYAPMEITVANVDDELSQEQIQRRSIDFAILCPCLSDDSDLRTCYAVLYKNWKYRSRHGTQSFPKLSKHLFRSTFRS